MSESSSLTNVIEFDQYGEPELAEHCLESYRDDCGFKLRPASEFDQYHLSLTNIIEFDRYLLSHESPRLVTAPGEH
jgi:hypothetical protein